MAPFPLRLEPFRMLQLSHQIDILGYALLLPDTSTQSHSHHLKEDLKLWGETTIDPRTRREPF